ncbi:hypothetical protein [Aurantimonas endophytica]|uniref:Uncharacterized protein n=1 Tax=Aurantimonas endophytica TaxID=1522175 RepID=A0A7W6MRH6_9HYPH|nr:hypothetical protein [Aurantimonas endophytica]MBB4005130.1 hypothetical protein [Aurantimonas endophytica]MCO6406205.1 hypothetical protein [Aurantimonas endophytica]
MTAAVVLVVLFLPAAFIYGRFRARHLRQSRPTLGGRLAGLLPMPAFLAACGAMAIVHETGDAGALVTGNGVIDAVLTLGRWIGQIELILFMVAGPYLLGVLIAALLLALDARGFLTLAAPVPLAPGLDDTVAKDPLS